ncbi:ribbon-helix-helix protein, CopG family [Actinopolyspora sp. H202]|uniref:ribbon-helix-helix protein, CopG family n=1 Tax=Actinopolyspora sp. H202 TaxID=1500456 RepID=UPI003EE5C1E1
MRTTIRLDDDVLAAVHERARRERRSAGQVLSELARQALTRSGHPTEPRGASHHGFRPLPHRGPAVSNELIDQIREEEAE